MTIEPGEQSRKPGDRLTRCEGSRSPQRRLSRVVTAGFCLGSLTSRFECWGWHLEYGAAAVYIKSASRLYGPVCGRRDFAPIVRLVSGDPIIWDWKFERGGKVVAYSTGSRHGGANECLLVDVDTGKVLEDWLTSSSGQAPL